MTESTQTTSTVSRRSTRLFEEDHMEMVPAIQVGCSSKESVSSKDSSGDEMERPKLNSKTMETGLNMERIVRPMVDVGRQLRIFPSTAEDKETQISQTLEAAKVYPKAQQEGRPLNYGVVVPGKIYRSSWPQVEDFPYLQTLGLKTVLSLVDKDFSPGFLDFFKQNDITHKVIDMPGTKKVNISEPVMQAIMKVVLDEANHPILIHCNHGKHRTGCAVAVIRHVAQWDVDSILEEYRGYANPKIRDCDVNYINNYQVSSLHNIFAPPISVTNIGRRRTMTEFVWFTICVLVIWATTGFFWNVQPWLYL